MSGKETFVGFWKPHKPRELISAKFNIPRTTGINDHDPRKPQAPGFSFGMRHRPVNSSCSPGPCYMIPSNVTRNGKCGTPAYSICSRPKLPPIYQTPGPDQYAPENTRKAIYSAAPAYSISSRCKRSSRERSPGPAAYKLPPLIGANIVNKKSAPSFSLYGRLDKGSIYEDFKKTPGPGTYKVVEKDIYKHKSPQYSMTARTNMPWTSPKPVTDAYYQVPMTFIRSQAPSFSFGVRHSDFKVPIVEQKGHCQAGRGDGKANTDRHN